MEKSMTLSILCFGFVLLDTVNSFPIDFSSVGEGVSNPLWLTNYFLTGFGFFVIIVSIIFGCVCCRNGKGFKEFRNSTANLHIPRPEGFVNPTLNSELTIFPPLGANANEICRFEPLPDIKCPAPNLRPAAFSYTEQEISSQDWFFDPYSNFPRNQLKYVQEYGRGWFGRVVEGEAQNITPEEKMTKVMVKILHEDATPTDHMYFLHEVKFYRDLKHPNILRLLGRCLETEPFLVILECYPNGDLKTFLSQNLPSAQALVEQGVTLQMCSNITSGLQYMHENKFIHTDLAARNCLVGPDLSVKIGDYGNSIEIFKSDYYCAGSVALPVRWCAPETLKCTDITIETREVTPPANIWSLGVVFWEICEFCKLPYSELNDDQVIVRVLGEKNYFLEKPNMLCLHKDEMYHLMKLCWKTPVQRPIASQIYTVLSNLISSFKITQKEVPIDSKQLSQDFEQRWQNLKPNSIPKKDNAVKADLNPSVDCTNFSKFKSAKVADSSYLESPLGVFMSSKSAGQESPRLCLKFDKKPITKTDENPLKEFSSTGEENQSPKEKAFVKNDPGDFAQKQSVGKVEFDYSVNPKVNPVNKIKGSEQEVDSWLKGVEINNEEDESFVRKISEAIRDLDATLAMEKTSSSEENSGVSSRQNSPGKDIKEINEPVVDFKLGDDTSSFINFTQKSFEITSLQNTEQPQSLNFTDPFNDKKNENYGPDSLIMPFIGEPMNKCKNDILDESLKESDSLFCAQSRNSSDTDDEIWRRRIEKGEISEKVKEKSKSIANLMILTHIDSDDSDIDFEKPFEKGLNRSSLIRRSGSFAKSSLSSNNFGSENDLTFRVLEDDFKESLKKLTNDHKEHGRFDSLGVILPFSANRENVWESLFKPSDPENETSNKTSSETDVNETTKDSELESKFSGETVSETKFTDQNTRNGNNFLGNVASEKLKNTEEKNLIEENEKKSKCGSGTFNTKCNNSSQNSSHIKENDFDVNTAKINSQLNTFFNEFSPLSKNEFLESVPNDLGIGNLTLEKEKSDVEIEMGNDCLSQKSDSVTFDGLKSLNEEHFNNLKLSENIHLEKAGGSDENAQKIFESAVVDTKGLKNIGKGNSFLPQITITEEPAEELTEIENLNFEFEKPRPKAFKFILKDDEWEHAAKVEQTKPVQTNNLDSFSPSVSEKFSSKSSENDYGELGFGENARVIVGACEDYTMDFFKGLKTTSEDIIKNRNVEQILKEYHKGEENLETWDKHLEKAFTQQLNNTNFDDISFRSLGLEFSEYQDPRQLSKDGNRFNPYAFSFSSIVEFIENEKLHTEKLEESLHINCLINLAVMANEEEYEHFKLRTPDDERSSDSGFRDKGSLSESVEDACEGKYNLEDIEAELEEAFMKGVFGNCETDKEKDSSGDLKNCTNFEYEESKFYEDGNKNEKDFSDIDGEIEFWHNKDESDYYPEISEFHPKFSQGWYLHPPDDTMSFDRNVNEDIVNALRNELQESLPVQSRSFDEFNDFYETEIEGAKRDLNIHYGNDFSVPLSPILEEQDSPSVTIQKNLKNSFLDGNSANKFRKHIVKLMESVKAVDTNSFRQYLDYMIENEGRDLYELEEIEEDFERKECVTSPIIVLEEEENLEDSSALEFSDRRGNSNSNSEVYKAQFVQESQEERANETIVNTKTKEKLCANKSWVQEDNFLEVMTDNSENDGLVFTPQMLSPDRERSFSEISRSSNGTRTGDALSEITLSSPDLVPDCFSSSVQEIASLNENEEGIRELNLTETKNKLNSLENCSGGQESFGENPKSCYNLNKIPTRNHFIFMNDKNHDFEERTNHDRKTLDWKAETKNCLRAENTTQGNDTYEMTTSFMGGEDDEEEETFLNLEKFEKTELLEAADGRTDKGGDGATQEPHKGAEDSDTTDWQSESSEDEEMSSSSGEFIWKDGNKVSKIKAASATDVITETSLYEKVQSEHAVAENGKNESSSVEETVQDEGNPEAEDDDEDDESSTGSSASITDFVPSAWNSQATPTRSALKSPNKKADKQKKNVWFKKQKYHCVYEYPREPSDSEDSEGSPYRQTHFEMNNSESPIKHFNYEVNTVELPNQHFPYGISKVIDFSTFADWDVVEGDDADLSSTDTDSENGIGKADSNASIKSELNFYNLSPFDYDFNTTDMRDGESEFFVSSSSRPFQGGSSAQFLPGTNHSVFSNTNNTENKNIKSANLDSKDFVTPDSGIEDSTNVTPSDKVNSTRENGLVKSKNSAYPEAGIINILDDLNYNFELNVKENEKKDREMESFGDNTKLKNGFSCSDSVSIPLSNIGLGELRHARGRLKLDLPRNHNSELGAIISKKNQ